MIFSALAGRYFRPSVVLVYYLNYLVSGLSPWSYHVSLVLIHVANSWLVFLLGRQLTPERNPVVPALAGLIFLVFSGHTEAISWIAGMADPLVTFFLLLGLVTFIRALEAPRPIAWIAGTALAFTGAVLSKESAAVFPGMMIVALFVQSGVPDATRIRRTLLTLAPITIIATGYLGVRWRILGFALVTLEGLGTGGSLAIARAFFFRSFLPQGPLLVWLWTHSIDLLGAAIVAAGFLWGLMRSAYRPMTLLTVWLSLALAPVLPLSISMVATDSERLIYLPSAFAALLAVWLLHSFLRFPSVAVIATLLLCWWNIVELKNHNRIWRDAGTMSREMIMSLGSTIRDHWRPGQPVFIMALPDNVRSAFLWRRGFPDALRVTAPDVAEASDRLYALSVITLWDFDARVDVAARGPRSFQVQLANSSVVANGFIPDGPTLSIQDAAPTGFVVDFAPLASGALVLSFRPRSVAVLGVLPSSSIPYGNVDRPTGAVTCDGQDQVLEGWALDEVGIKRIVIARAAGDPLPGAARGTETESKDWQILGEGTRVPRPDVNHAYPQALDSANAGWRFVVPCKTLRATLPPGPHHIVIIAENRRGETASLGARALAFSN